MDQFLKIGEEKPKQIRVQMDKKNALVDKKRVARLKRTFLPYWARETELQSRMLDNTDANH